MSESTLAASPQPAVLDIEPQHSQKRAILPFVALSLLVTHPVVGFEEGAQEGLEAAQEAGDSLQLLITHFRRREPLFVGHLVGRYPFLRHIMYETGITAREELWEKPGIGYVLKHSAAYPVRRSIEHPNETPRGKAEREADNLMKMFIAGRHMAEGFHWYIHPDGSSKKTIIKDGEKKRVNRDLDKLLPIRSGFARSLEYMTPEERKRVKMLAIAVFYGEPPLPTLVRPTVFVSRPEEPVPGTLEDRRKQGEDLLERSFEGAVALHRTRKFVGIGNKVLQLWKR